MSRSSGRRALPAILAVVVGVSSAHAATRLEVSGEVVGRAPRLEVRVVVFNGGDQAAVPLAVVGELLGERREARVARGVEPGSRSAVILDFAPVSARAGCTP